MDTDIMYEPEFVDDSGVISGKTFYEDGREFKWDEQYNEVYLDFDHWAVWSATDVDSGEEAYFVVDVDTEFIDWGPVETLDEAQEFMQSKMDDYNDDDDFSDKEFDEALVEKKVIPFHQELQEVADSIEEVMNRAEILNDDYLSADDISVLNDAYDILMDYAHYAGQERERQQAVKSGSLDEGLFDEPSVIETATANDSPEGPAQGADTGIAAMLIKSINDEWVTIDAYNSIIATLRAEGKDDMIKVLEDINNEENLHVGMLQTLLKNISPNANSIEVGEQEAKEIISEENAE